MSDLTLFDRPETRARATDPPTSHHAASSMQGRPADAQRFSIMLELRDMYPDGLTGDELDQRMGWRYNTAVRRLSELLGVGWITRLDDTRPTRTGRHAHVHRLASKGLQAMEGIR